MIKKIWLKDTPKKVNQQIEVFGWVNALRDHKNILFIDLKDRSGILQLVIPKELPQFEQIKKIKIGSVIKAKGKIIKRDPKLVNPKIPTGEIELLVEEINLISESDLLPFPIENEGYQINEEIRLRYRYLDLRRTRLQKNLFIRHQVFSFIREWLTKKDFIEIETPILTKSTPEGARDFLVPARLYPGKFYALPQSPQQYKQLLMIAGFERYFQIARCFRDEDPRGDRQPEFTQLDLEISFVEEEEILQLIENLIVDLVKALFPQKQISQIPFPRLDYQSVIEKYNSDRPDLRKDKKDENELAFAFVINFPMFEWKETEKRWDTMHHPFTKMKYQNPQEIAQKLHQQPGQILAHQYDLVCNGYEIGGGSIRETNIEILEKVFEFLGHSKEEIQKKFGHLFTAFKYGVPPHGGIGLGLDRLLAILLNEPNIREVIAFPKTGEARDPMMDIPSEVEKEQLEELQLKISKEENKSNK